MSAQSENASSPEEFQARYGLEPTMVANLEAVQPLYQKKGMALSLEQIYVLEVGPLPERLDEDEDEDEEA